MATDSKPDEADSAASGSCDGSALIRHGVDCPKVAHVGDGHLHGEDDDRTFMVDGLEYCGRCHHWIG